VGTIGCNFRCGFCQNWQISQIAEGTPRNAGGYKLSPEDIVKRAEAQNCSSIAYTYTEPTIFFEYALDTAELASERHLSNIFVTNGYMTSEALETIQPFLDACNVDLKSFRDQFYRKTCRGRLEPVLESIRTMKSLDIWVEITTLLIPGHNDDDAELRDIAEFIAGVDPGIPWHISRFHPDYELSGMQATPVERLNRAFALGREAGLHYVYKGNLPGEAVRTQCPNCRAVLIRRQGFLVEENRIRDSTCPECGRVIAGVFR
jgi:pyruvate formate lyase activating enzyme